MKVDLGKYFTLKKTKLSGIYFLLNGGTVTYIGQTRNFFSRLMCHSRTFDSVRFIPCDGKKLNYYERRWIKKFRPKGNIAHNDIQTTGHDLKALLIRIPVKTWRALKRQADQNNRSLTAEISNILEIEVLPRTVTTSNSVIH